MSRRWWMVMMGPLWASAAATGCQQAQSRPITPTPVAAYDLPITRVVTDYEEFPGSTEAIYSVQVTARVMLGLAASNCWQMVVFPPPEGAEIRTRTGLVVGIALAWLSPLASRPSALIFGVRVSTFITRHSGPARGIFPARL